MNLSVFLRRFSSISLKVLIFIIIFLSSFLYFGTNYVRENFGLIPMDSIIFTITVPLEGTENSKVFEFIKECFIPTVFTTIAIWFVLTIVPRINYKIEYSFNDEKKEFLIKPKKWVVAVAYIMPIFILLGCINHSTSKVELYEHFKDLSTDSKFIEKNYIEPKTTKITFPEEKRNLIYIFMESMETSYMSTKLGGNMAKNLIPGLTELARENIHFSNKTEFGGAIQVAGTSWTIGSMVANTCGLPLKLPIENNSMGKFQKFLPQIHTLGDILESEGYNQTLIVGSNSVYGGRKNYFEQHGNYTVKDWNTAQEEELIPKGYKVWWGYEDEYLYDYAKIQLSELAARDEPFNLTLLTVDTHFTDGYVCELCDEESVKQYDNVISCADRQIVEFISWFQKQDYYKNTTIIITGDHLTMDKNYIKNTDNQRTIFNTFINSAVSTDKTKNRIFTVMDMFPTTLAAMGVTIEGERLGLGTNLFSGIKTLPEVYGINDFDKELGLRSSFYNSKLK